VLFYWKVEKIVGDGNVSDIIRSYLQASSQSQAANSKTIDRSGTGEAIIDSPVILDKDGNIRDTFSMGETIIMEYDVTFQNTLEYLYLSVDISQAESGLRVLHLINEDSGFQLTEIKRGTYRLRIQIPDCMLYPNFYYVSFFIASKRREIEYVRNIVSFTIIQSNVSKRTIPFYTKAGIYHQPSYWSDVTHINEGSVLLK
jgi:hypothetical protein